MGDKCAQRVAENTGNLTTDFTDGTDGEEISPKYFGELEDENEDEGRGRFIEDCSLNQIGKRKRWQATALHTLREVQELARQ